METPHNDTPAEENIPKFRGLYRYVKIPVKALDCIIVACIAVIIIVVALEHFVSNLSGAELQLTEAELQMLNNA